MSGLATMFNRDSVIVQHKYLNWTGEARDTHIERKFKYFMCESWLDLLSSYQVKLTIPFEAIGDISACVDSKIRNKMLLKEKPFKINGLNPVDWAKENLRGKCILAFTEDYGWSYIFKHGVPKRNLIAQFCDRDMAMVFKLMFGGKLID